jgi:tyrosinase
MKKIAGSSIQSRSRWGYALVVSAFIVGIGMTTTMLAVGFGIPGMEMDQKSCRKYTLSGKLLLAAQEFRRRLARSIGLEEEPEQLLIEATKTFEPGSLDGLINDDDVYTYVTTGSCEDAAASAITSQEECGRAAESLGKSQINARATKGKKYTSGCYWNSKAWRRKLWFNSNGLSNPATGSLHLICRQSATQEPPMAPPKARSNWGPLRIAVKWGLGGETLQEPTPPKPFAWGCKHRLRKDWVDLTRAEQALYLAGVNKIKTTPYGNEPNAGPGHNIYDVFIMIHGETANKAYAHQAAGFLAWHRKYLIEYETAIRTVHPRFKCVTVPYWDWSAETYECKRNGVFQGASKSCETYHAASQFLRDFGGPGDSTKTKAQGAPTHGSSGAGPVGCLTTGPFKNWVDHTGKCLSRGVNWRVEDQKPFTGRIRLAEILQMKNYGSQFEAGFRVVLEGIPHGSTHNYLGGHMRSFISPADPIFFSHHSYIDKVWAVWQDCHDYDTKEIALQLLEKGHDESMFAYYQPTRTYPHDNVDDTMLFNFPTRDGSAGDPGKCSKSESACADCVHQLDFWCANNNWGGTCRNLCSDVQCVGKCGVSVPEVINMHDTGKAVLANWVYGETTPAHMHSVHLFGDRSYTYAPDEFERYLKEKEPAALGGCKLDSHASVQKAFNLLEEASRFHHPDKAHGLAAREHAHMVQKAFNQTRDGLGRKLGGQNVENVGMLGTHVFKASMRLAQQKECEEMAAKCGIYRKEFKCDTDQPRFWVPWMGNGWQVVMEDPDLAKMVFQDPCCNGDDDALRPGEVPGLQ